jgi:hypothetical protein
MVEDVRRYVKRHSRTARLFGATADQLIDIAAAEVRVIERLAKPRGWDRKELEAHLTAVLTELTATWNPLMWAVLKILIPIVVRLVLNWWFTELELRRMEADT